MAANILKIISSILAIIIISVLLKLFEKKSQLSNIKKFIIVTVCFSLVAVGCNFLNAKIDNNSFISVSNSAVIIGGLLFGGPVGIITGTIAGVERFFAVYYGASSITRYSVSITLIAAGLFSASIRKLVQDGDHIKWYYAPVCSLVIESFGLLLIFLFNLGNLGGVYEIVNATALWNILLNVLCTIAASLGAFLSIGLPIFKINKPISIQSKVQINLAIAVIVGFISITAIAYGIFDNFSKEATKNSIQLSFNDVKDNIAVDAKELFMDKFDTHSQHMKTAGHVFSGDLYNHENESRNLANNDPKDYVSTTTVISKDGTIVASSDQYIDAMANISEFNISLNDVQKDEHQYFDIQYYEQLHNSYFFIYCRYRSNKDDLFLLVGLNPELYSSYYLKNSVDKGIAARHLGENGYLLVTDMQNNVLSSPTDAFQDELSFVPGEEKEIKKVKVNDIDYYSSSTVFYDYKIVALMNKDDCDLNKNISLYITLLTEIIVFFALYSIIYLSINHSVISPLKRVNSSLDSICKGQLDERVEESTSKELRALSEDINSTVDSLKEYMGREAKMIQKELNFAKEIQLSALPTNFPSTKEFELFATMDTAKEVGGDFYDFYYIDDRHLCILMADVSGKGVPAALFMMQSKSIIKSFIESKIPLDEAMRKANTDICQTNRAEMFVTVWVGILDLDTGVLEYVNAGHNNPLFKRAGDKFNYMQGKRGFVFAGMEGYPYVKQSITLGKGDELFLYTDGVTEAAATDNELYGDPRLEKTVNNIKVLNSKEFCDAVLSDVRKFTAGAEQSDDITMFHIKYFGSQK